MKTAFTMIELIFVIIVIGILTGVALPRLLSPVDDSHITRGKSDIVAIRNAITLQKGRNVMRGVVTNGGNPDFLDDAATNNSDERLFDGNTTLGNLLTYAIISQDENGKWMKTGNRTYTFKISNTDVTFTYDETDGTFDCDHNLSDCKKLAQ